MNSAQNLSSIQLGPHEFEIIGKVFQDELQRRALSRKSDEAEALAAKLINAYQAGIRRGAVLRMQCAPAASTH